MGNDKLIREETVLLYHDIVNYESLIFTLKQRSRINPFMYNFHFQTIYYIYVKIW